jgi:hypothetical protein
VRGIIKQRATFFLQPAMRVWVFPLIVVVLLILLSALRLSGSSVGMYTESLNGTDEKDNQLIANSPRPIRSDEWEIVTPLTVSQVNNGFPKVNQDIGDGQDMSVVLDMPYAEWGTIFKPQNWAFFVAPVEYAFAFKWWLMAAIVILGCYTFVLTLLPKKYLLASLVAIAFFFSPFIHWWYQSITLLPIGYGLFILAIVITLLQKSMSKRAKYVLSGALAYLSTCLAFVLYVPFLVPIGLVVAAFLAGSFINDTKSSKHSVGFPRKLLWIGIPLLLASCVFILFLKTRGDILNAIANTVYPGHRTEASGGFSVGQLLGGYYNLQLQDDTKAIHYGFNQSEASSFILLSPFLLPFLGHLLLSKMRKKQPTDWRIILLLVILVIFLMRLFIPALEPLFNLMQFNRIPHNRLVVGLGILNLLLLVIGIQWLYKVKKPISNILLYSSTAITFISVAAVGLFLRATYDNYIESLPKIALISLVMAAIVWLLLKKRMVWAMLLLALFSLVSVISINPLYRGLGIITNSALSTKIAAIGDKDGKWVVGDNVAYLENIATANSLQSLSGVFAYPQLDLWKPLDTSPASQDVYNRYAHVFFTIKPLDSQHLPQGAYLEPPALDAFRVVADPCSLFLREQNVRYALVSVPIESACVTQIDKIVYPMVTVYIYKIKS